LGGRYLEAVPALGIPSYFEPMRIFLSGIAGTAMGGLAGLLRDQGHEVMGSDVAFYAPIGPMLRESGIQLFEGYRAENLDQARPDLHVIGNVCRQSNPEVQRGAELGLERLHIADALQRFVLPKTSPLVVAGTHGKTTTSSLVAHLLDEAGYRPGFLIGGIVKGFGRGSRLAAGPKLELLGRGRPDVQQSKGTEVRRAPPFVLEGDEYDTAFWEKTAKFLHYGAEVAILTSIEHDHVDIYPTFEAYREAFRQFILGLPETGLLLAAARDSVVRELASEAACPVLYYGVAGENWGDVAPHFLAEPATENENGISFDLFVGGVLAGRYLSRLPGRHNLQNALGAIGAASAGYGAPLSLLRNALTTFQGVKRRQDWLGSPRGIRVYDDFAHHPTAVRETLLALRAKHPEGRLIAVFEPKSATACRRQHQHEYPAAFLPATHVLLAPVGRPELPDSEKLSVEELVRDIQARGGYAQGPFEVPELVAHLTELSQPGDTIAVLSNGSFGGIHQALLSALGHGIDGADEPKARPREES
jgi:UDP-N-acetylmuramate: L-alanyl-gamma-D-glutamyl-meso-diaminopimelate ligase